MRNIHVMILMIGAIILGAVIGSIAASYHYAKKTAFESLFSSGAEFSEFTGLLLACIAIIMTLFGVFLAVLAVYGFSAIQEKVTATAENAAQKSVEASLAEGGELYKLTQRSVQRIIYRGVGLAESSGALDPEELDGNKDA